ncbi:MAG: DUF3810 domain-containing protein [Flavobacteriaceae bacterium]|nr:DUF3810 domain-containing protein [Flavobacteriaceae bacterium]MDG2290324.1 DUF3810 domain-containing protein [Flavobacteriaceae bacterium]
MGFLILPLDNEWVQSLYGQSIYPNIAAVNHFLWSKVPFSIGDLGYAIGILLIFIRLKRFKFKRHIGLVLAAVFIIISLFYVSWGMHYFKTPLRVSRKLPATISVEHLKETTQHYTYTLTALHQQINPDPATAVVTPLETDALLALATSTMEHSSLRPSKIHGKAKATLFPTLLSYMGFGGYLNPFTHEAQVNTLQPKLRVLTTACHEIAHQWGIAAEDEANYISIKATTASEVAVVRYAGHLLAFQHLINSIYRADAQQAKAVMDKLPEGILENIREVRAFWEKYQNPFEVVFERSYDQYLKANQQQAGIKSYSLVVDLLVDDYINR